MVRIGYAISGSTGWASPYAGQKPGVGFQGTVFRSAAPDQAVRHLKMLWAGAIVFCAC